MIYIFWPVFCIIAFGLCVACYCFGVKHGFLAQKERQPHVPNPIQIVKDKIEDAKEAKEAEKVQDEFDKYMNYSAETALQFLKTERLRGVDDES